MLHAENQWKPLTVVGGQNSAQFTSCCADSSQWARLICLLPFPTIGKFWDPGGGVLQGGLHPPRGFCLIPGPLFPSELQHKSRHGLGETGKNNRLSLRIGFLGRTELSAGASTSNRQVLMFTEKNAAIASWVRRSSRGWCLVSRSAAAFLYSKTEARWRRSKLA